MATVTSTKGYTDDDLTHFHGQLAKANMRGQWQNEAVRSTGQTGVWDDRCFLPKAGGQGHLWPWSDVRPFLEESCVAVPESNTSRRAIMFNNPALAKGTTNTINMGIQMIQPGETAWAHRHSIAALRFVIQGHPDLTTVVDGAVCPMEDFDLVLTPNWSWHDHHNRSDRPVYWLDVLDVPLVLGLNQTFYEDFGAKEQAPRAAGSSGPKLRFPWRDVQQILRNQAAQHTYQPEGSLHDYVNPHLNGATGGATVPTLLCRAQWLSPGLATKTLRRTSSAVYFVLRGEGVTEVDGQELRWGKNDCFVVPNWTRHRHVNQSKSSEAVLFSVHDTPVLKALGLYREEAQI